MKFAEGIGICPVCDVVNVLDYSITTFKTGYSGATIMQPVPCCEECFEQFQEDFAEAKRKFAEDYARKYVQMKRGE